MKTLERPPAFIETDTSPDAGEQAAQSRFNRLKENSWRIVKGIGSAVLDASVEGALVNTGLAEHNDQGQYRFNTGNIINAALDVAANPKGASAELAASAWEGARQSGGAELGSQVAGLAGQAVDYGAGRLAEAGFTSAPAGPGPSGAEGGYGAAAAGGASAGAGLV